MNLAIIGVPYNSAGVTTAEALAPSVLRAEGLIDALAQHNDVADYGDIEITPKPASRRDRESGVIAPETLLGMVMATRAAVTRAYQDRRMPVLIGGDCPVLLGGLLAARDQLGHGPALLFVDGHEDSYPPKDSLTGEAADMELGLALGFTKLTGLDELGTLLPLVNPHEVVLLGPRDRAEVEADGIRSIGTRVVVLDDTEMRAAGIGVTVQSWLDQFQHQPGRFWFHLDWDVLSTDDMPAVSYPQPGGLTWGEVDEIARAAIHADHLIGIDTTIYNPQLDRDRSVARRIVAFLADVTH